MITIGRSVGKYRVLDRIGRGGMGTVFRALDDTLQREVAIKVLNSDITDPDALKRFRAEAMALARLQHPAIATLFELCEDDGDLLMVMEFVRGETLQKLAERMVRVPPDFAAQLCSQALDGLAHAHRAGIVHRDLKPGNLMVTDDGLVKVMDFGIARIAGTEHMTSAGFSMGTPAYMAPEQVLGQEADARADLYAVGVVLYRLWSGRLPFEGDTPFAIAHKQINDAPTPLHVACPDLPAWCDAVLARALAKDPADRFQTAQEFKAALATSARFIALDELATTTMRTPLTVPVGMAAGSASGSQPWAPARTPPATQAPVTNPAGPTTATDRTLVVSARQLFAGVGAVILVLILLAIGTVIAVRRMSSRAPSAATPPAAAPTTTTTSAPAVQAPPPTASPTAPASSAAAPPPATRANPTKTAHGPAVPIPPAPASVPSATVRPSSPASSGPAATAKTSAPANASADSTLPPITFGNLKLVVIQGDKAHEEDAELQFAGGRISIVGPNTAVTTSIPYTAVRAISSARSRQPRWRDADGHTREAKLSGGPLGFMKSDRNWLALVTAKAAYVLRVDDGRLLSLSNTTAQRTGVPVVRLLK